MRRIVRGLQREKGEVAESARTFKFMVMLDHSAGLSISSLSLVVTAVINITSVIVIFVYSRRSCGSSEISQRPTFTGERDGREFMNINSREYSRSATIINLSVKYSRRVIIQIICVTIRTYGWHLFETRVSQRQKQVAIQLYICTLGRFIVTRSAMSELSLNDTSFQNICIDIHIYIVLRSIVPDRSDSNGLTRKICSRRSAALNVYVHSWPRDLIFLVK